MAHTTDANNDALAPANTQRSYQIKRSQLPLSCPLPEQKLWNSHPRVFLAIDETGEALCPYCGTHYVLVD